MEKVMISTSIGAVVIYITVIGCLIYLGIKGITYVKNHGLKSVIEEIWEGPK